ncbi:small secreted protein [Purpureocillium lavendulum]|uniref:Small secreted protein n=1 Tax=Purpureocillium lavendulum TaxID=1247861 RepID=A0AB34FIR2_9HYPO|nr:small secreted protein [Purpureocillium lavendulum]
MLRSLCLTIAAVAAASASLCHAEPDGARSSLNVTALSAADGESTLECWQLDARFQPPPSETGTEGPQSVFLGDVSNGTYSIIPGGLDTGLHHPPAKQFVLFFDGVVEISLPTRPEKVVIRGGQNGLMLQVDTADVSHQGHRIKSLGSRRVSSLRLPLRPGTDVGYQVLYSGPCRESELMGSY